MSSLSAGNFSLESFELLAALGAALDEDVLVEAGLHLQRELRRAVEQLLWCRLGEVGEEQGLGGAARLGLTRGARAGAGERINVGLVERPLRRRLAVQCRRVAFQVLREDFELGGGPVATESMRRALGCLSCVHNDTGYAFSIMSHALTTNICARGNTRAHGAKALDDAQWEPRTSCLAPDIRLAAVRRGSFFDR
jgi:hypothetical protein